MRKLLAVLMLVAASADAKGKGRAAPTIFGELKPVVGAWAEYSFTREKDDESEKGTYRTSVVGKEGEDFWIEQKFRITEPKPKKGEEGGTLAMLIGKGQKPKRVLMKAGDHVMDMTAMMGMAGGPAKDVSKHKKAGKEKVTVPAGTFEAEKVLFEGQQIWMKSGVGPYGMVKQVSEDKDGTTTLLLLDHGKGAKREVEVPPASGGFPGMPPGMMPPGMPNIGEMMKGRGKPKPSEDEESEDEEQSEEE